MSHSHVSNLMHCIFSTKNRRPFIDSDLESRLWPFLGGIARENRMKALAIEGTADHVHAPIFGRLLRRLTLRALSPRPLSQCERGRDSVRAARSMGTRCPRSQQDPSATAGTDVL
jgi:Transposase IS200 like